MLDTSLDHCAEAPPPWQPSGSRPVRARRKPTLSKAEPQLLAVALAPDRNPPRVYLARLAPGSRPAMSGALERIARLASGGRIGAEALPWHSLRYQHTQAIRRALVEQACERTGRPMSPATVNKHLAALRGVLAEAWRLGLMPAEDRARASDLGPVRGGRPLSGRALESSEIAALFAACARDTGPAGLRDAAVLGLGVGAGLRRAEIASLELADVDLDDEVVRVVGKGRKVREVPVKGGTLGALRAWIGVRGAKSGPLVCPVNKAGRLQPRRLSPQAVLRICEKRGREAGLRGFRPHDLRRSYISALLDGGVDLSVASDLAGHASPTTTKRYDRRGERARHRAAEVVAVPFFGRASVRTE